MDDLAEELTGADYMFRPLVEIASHPDFNTDVYAFLGEMTHMTTAGLQAVMERNATNG